MNIDIKSYQKRKSIAFDLILTLLLKPKQSYVFQA
jgi:hypothetical protein